ncbi:uncharacterized protein LAESUDRAFT_702867 [Laetiporus sulphureus 93-53]|uniref:RNase III domain-containing protein n=1 Tax=Laetiporus sulphureus 93-53 TaxID=1314785 RepID=A0A165DHV6_9APHY|nr:uncharacterized protein LAESUDRAFT_702867 [Laetiporus sulphureus 93-53]KZT04915.1 hypothetical protein LAESUDRAFT_702867 [Laetiporus sulphureus 93-53]
MSKALARLCSTAGHVSYRRIPAGLRLQSRSLSNVQQPFQPERPSQPDSRPPYRGDFKKRKPPSAQSLQELAEGLNARFKPLNFPPELAARILTHATHSNAYYFNSNRLSFIGRRVLQSYLLMFVHQSPALRPDHDYEMIMERTLNTRVLGRHVAPAWEFGELIKWRPVTVGPLAHRPADDDIKRFIATLDPSTASTVGVHKVHGTSVEALVGGVFHQFGGAIAHRLFHTRMLPHLLLPGQSEGLHDAFHEDAHNIYLRMGGRLGDLAAPARQNTATSEV